MTRFEAVKALVGGRIHGPSDGPISKFVFYDGQTPPTEKEIDDKLKELEDDYKKQAYARARAESFDPIPEQLDQIYHDLDGWKAKVKAVKDKYPKPT